MENTKITIIGGGNLGGAIAKGLVKSKTIAPQNLTVADASQQALDALSPLGMNVTHDNIKAISDADIVMLAVKPWFVNDVINEIKKDYKSENKIFISLAAGVTAEDIESLFEKTMTVFAVMPNTAIAIGESMTCISSRNSTEEQQQLIQKIFSSMGEAIILPENMMGAATILASSGTAFALRYIRAAVQGGVAIGFNAKVATGIVAQVVKGAAELLIQNDSHPEEEIDKVTTPKGTTITGLTEMEKKGMSTAVAQGHIAAVQLIEKNSKK